MSDDNDGSNEEHVVDLVIFLAWNHALFRVPLHSFLPQSVAQPSQ